MAVAANAHFYKSHDGLNLYYREFGAQQDGTPVICLPGLTRNSRDFENLAARLGAQRRVLTPDFRGRGYSEHDPEWHNYHPGTYVTDVWTLLDALAIKSVIVIGTSLGGLCAQAMASQQRERVAGVLLNDIGPEINAAGLARVKDYVGEQPPVGSWQEAAEQARETYGDWLPGLGDDAWLEMARRAYREDDNGVPRLDIDKRIGDAVRVVGPQVGDPWTLFEALEGIPTTLLWGVMSDILTDDIIGKMRERLPALHVVPVANRGHVPLLDEPECLDAIDSMLDRVP